MTRSRRRQLGNRPLRGLSLAWLALAVQVLLPFLLAVDIARADAAGSLDVPICSASPAIHHAPGQPNQQSPVEGCPICAAVAVGQTFTAPLAIPLPLPQGRVQLALGQDASSAAAILLVTAYRSRAPPLFV